MIKKLLLSLLPLLILANDSVDPYANIDHYTLQNGMQVYLLSDSKAQNVAISVDVYVGQRSETNKNAGISHLVEHMVFRDSRIAHHDYLDYIKERGATAINANTAEYKTTFYATIDPNQAIWLTKNFATMLMEFPINKEDLAIEKGALQIEIGNANWLTHTSFYLASFFKGIGALFPERERNIFYDDFGIKKEKELPKRYFQQINNKKFSLEAVKKQYNNYYYPKNMRLRVVGNFDPITMKQTIQMSFGAYSKDGNLSTRPTIHPVVLQPNPYINHDIADSNKNYIAIGAKYIIESYQKYIVLYYYMQNLANRVQQQLRNNKGQTYSVSPFDYAKAKAGLIGISFETTHEAFEKSLQLTQNIIQSDVASLHQEDISQALADAAAYYTSQEHDSDTLMNLVDMQEYINDTFSDQNITAYSAFNAITPTYFQTVISTTFQPQFSYLYTNKDYLLFPYDAPLLSLILLIVVIAIALMLRIILLKRAHLNYTHRDILFSRRLSSRFTSLVQGVSVFVLALLLSEWIEVALSYVIYGNFYAFKYYQMPYSLLYESMSFLLFFTIFITLLRTLFKSYFFKFDLLEEKMVIIGNSILVINKSDIASIDITPYRFKYYKHILGFSLLFLKPLVKITLHNGTYYYLRTSNAKALREDLTQWLTSQETP